MTPGEQAERMADAAAGPGARRLGLLAPDEDSAVCSLPGCGRGAGTWLAAAAGAAAPAHQRHRPVARELAAQAGPEGLDAVMLGQGGDRARAAAAALAAALPDRPRLLGNSLWAQDPVVAQEPALAGAWFPGPDPQARGGLRQPLPGRLRHRRRASPASPTTPRRWRPRGAEPGGNPPLGQPMLGADGPIRLRPAGWRGAAWPCSRSLPPASRCWWSRRRCPAAPDLSRAPAPVPRPRWPHLGAAGLIGGVPSLVLLALMLRGALDAGRRAARPRACLAGALLVAAVWLGNLARLAEALRRAAAEDARLVPPRPPPTPLLPAVREIAEGVARLARTLAERGELVGQLRRADEAIVESLPDPLLVLSPARVPLRANAAARAIFGGASAAPAPATWRRCCVTRPWPRRWTARWRSSGRRPPTWCCRCRSRGRSRRR